MKRSIYIFLFLVVGVTAFANKGESSRILVHTLNYLGNDYRFAVDSGRVISEVEYNEMKEFSKSAQKYFKDISAEWTDEDSVIVRSLLLQLDSLIKIKASPDDVLKSSFVTKNKILSVTGLKMTPSTFPSLDQGKIIYQTNCARCHGENGYGDGPESIGLEPAPRNFHEAERMKSISPFFAYNTIRLGVPGTGMKANPQLSDDEVWDAAFYILSIRYQNMAKKPELIAPDIKAFQDTFPLDVIATLSDDELLDLEALKGKNASPFKLAALRLHKGSKASSEFINLSLNYLDGAISLYRENKYSEAQKLALLSYLEGIEPIEMQLRANDPALMMLLEQRMHNFRKMMDGNHSAIEVQDSLKALKVTIQEANNIVGVQEYSFFLALLMAASILLREGLEAFLVIMVILSVIKNTPLKQSKWWVHGGWILAVLAGVVLWFIGDTLLQNHMQHIEIIEGAIAFIAVAMLMYVGFWLHSKSEIGKWKEYVGRKMKGMVNNGSLIGLAGLSFFVVFREVFESVLFLSAMNIETKGQQSFAILSGVLCAFVVVLALAFVVLRFSAKLPIPKLFKISSIIMGILAVILAGKGTHSFQEIGLVGIHGIPMFRAELLGVFPTIETTVAQLIALFLVAFMWKKSS